MTLRQDVRKARGWRSPKPSRTVVGLQGPLNRCQGRRVIPAGSSASERPGLSPYPRIWGKAHKSAFSKLSRNSHAHLGLRTCVSGARIRGFGERAFSSFCISFVVYSKQSIVWTGQIGLLWLVLSFLLVLTRVGGKKELSMSALLALCSQ